MSKKSEKIKIYFKLIFGVVIIVSGSLLTITGTIQPEHFISVLTLAGLVYAGARLLKK